MATEIGSGAGGGVVVITGFGTLQALTKSTAKRRTAFFFILFEFIISANVQKTCQVFET